MVKLNPVGGVSGATAGGLSGFSVGGPPGAAIGAGIGGLAGLFSGNPEMERKISQFTPEQRQAFDKYIQDFDQQRGGYQNALQYQQNFLDPNSSQFRDFEEPYLRQFEQHDLPNLAEQFAGYGSNSGALSSSGFGQAIGGAQANLRGTLANLKAQLMQNASQSLFGQYNQGASQAFGTRAFEPVIQQGQGGFGTQALSSILQGYGQGVGQNLPGLNRGSQSGGQQTPPVSTNQVNLTGKV